jgi:hypothetical protein
MQQKLSKQQGNEETQDKRPFVLSCTEGVSNFCIYAPPPLNPIILTARFENNNTPIPITNNINPIPIKNSPICGHMICNTAEAEKGIMIMSVTIDNLFLVLTTSALFESGDDNAYKTDTRIRTPAITVASACSMSLGSRNLLITAC